MSKLLDHWKTVPGAKYLEVSQSGFVRRRDFGYGDYRGTGRTHAGHWFVRLKGGRSVRVPLLMYWTFVSSGAAAPELSWRYRDGNSANSRLSNLCFDEVRHANTR